MRTLTIPALKKPRARETQQMQIIHINKESDLGKKDEYIPEKVMLTDIPY